MHRTLTPNKQANSKRGRLDGRSEMLSFVGTRWIQMLVSSSTSFFQIAWIRQFWSKFFVAPDRCNQRMQDLEKLGQRYTNLSAWQLLHRCCQTRPPNCDLQFRLQSSTILTQHAITQSTRAHSNKTCLPRAIDKISNDMIWLSPLTMKESMRCAGGSMSQ